MRIKMNKQPEKRRLPRNQSKQQGAVLIVAVVFLLIITIIGLSAIKMSGIDTQISGNSVTSMLTYQGVESALGKTVPDNQTMFNINEADNKFPNAHTVVVADFFQPEEVSGGAMLTSTATIQVEDRGIDCPKNAPASSTNYGCNVFRIDATTKLTGTGAKSSHTIGLVDHAPKIYK